MPYKAPAKERFWPKVKKSQTGCWLWTGAKNRKGYGSFRVVWTKSATYAHRYSWEIHHGEIPDGLMVLHKCDTPACVNPDHLYLGTNKDNMRDKRKRGRSKGEWAGRTILTGDQVIEIRKLYNTGNYTQKQLAERFGVARETVRAVVRRESWTHI